MTQVLLFFRPLRRHEIYCGLCIFLIFFFVPFLGRSMPSIPSPCFCHLFPECNPMWKVSPFAVSYTHLRAHETPEHLVCRLLLEKKKKQKRIKYKKRSTN